MGRAIVRQPQVFLFDEPLSNLDAKLRAQTRLEIQKLHRELGITSLFVTHDQVEAMTLAQRMIVMNGGVMEQFGTPEEVYTRPATTFVASFIGSPPMNLLKDAPDAKPGVITGIRPEHLDITPTGWACRSKPSRCWVPSGWSMAAGRTVPPMKSSFCAPGIRRRAQVLGAILSHVTPRADRMHSL
jgi:sn-glycerol 3-phosphate transport system ATP-binding protein